VTVGAVRRMPRPGHYAGATSQDGTISFDVSPRGRHVTNLMVTVTAGPPGGRSIVDLPVAIGSIFPVEPGGRWRGRVSGAGVTVTVEAHLNCAGITGDLRVDIESGDAEALTTGPLTWQADCTDHQAGPAMRRRA
jgi:hypothetical protein